MQACEMLVGSMAGPGRLTAKCPTCFGGKTMGEAAHMRQHVVGPCRVCRSSLGRGGRRYSRVSDVSVPEDVE